MCLTNIRRLFGKKCAQRSTERSRKGNGVPALNVQKFEIIMRYSVVKRVKLIVVKTGKARMWNPGHSALGKVASA